MADTVHPTVDLGAEPGLGLGVPVLDLGVIQSITNIEDEEPGIVESAPLDDSQDDAALGRFLQV